MIFFQLATIVTKTKSEFVRISREDYNVMLKQNQQEFLNRMKVASVSRNQNKHPADITTKTPKNVGQSFIISGY